MAQTLAQEIRQARPFDSPEQEAFLNIVRTAARLTDRLDPVLGVAGLSPAQYNVLRILQGAGAKGLCRNEIRDRMLTRMPDMTRLLDRMEEAGLVVRSRDEEDRRMVRTKLTPQSRRMLSSLAGPVAEEHRRSMGHLSATELRALIDLLTKVRAAT